MKCPNCGKEMKNRSYSKLEEFYHCKDDEYYYKRNYYEKFVCSDCKISIVNDEWNIPDDLRATEKQVEACNFICRILNIEHPPLTKRAVWHFIHDHIEEAVDIKNKREGWFCDYDDCDGDSLAVPCEEDCF